VARILAPARRRGAAEAERAFVRHFLAGKPGVRFNAAQSVLAAGYRMGRRSAHVQGARLLSRASVQRLIESAHRRQDIFADAVIAEWRRLAFSDLRELLTVDADGEVHVHPSAEWPEDAARALGEITEHKTTRTTTRRTRAVGKPGEPGYVPEGEVSTKTVGGTSGIHPRGRRDGRRVPGDGRARSGAQWDCGCGRPT
jgi:Terminase small subunit